MWNELHNGTTSSPLSPLCAEWESLLSAVSGSSTTGISGIFAPIPFGMGSPGVQCSRASTAGWGEASDKTPVYAADVIVTYQVLPEKSAWLTIGLVNDMFTERQNDDYPYKELASQSDFDRF